MLDSPVISCLLKLNHYPIDKGNFIYEVLTYNSRVKIISDINEIISDVGCSQTNH